MIAEEVQQYDRDVAPDDLSDHRASALPVPEPEPKKERSHPLAGKCRLRGCSGKLRDHTPDDSDGPSMTLKCDSPTCGLAFSFTPAPSQFSRRERRGRAS